MSATIFIVDDSDTNLATAEEALEDSYNVMTMPSAAKMFSLLEKLKPSLILLDIEMPQMNGFEALEKLKQHDEWGKIPVVFLTGTTSPDIEKRGSELGAVGLVTKPFTQQVLLEKIKSIINE